MPNLSDDSLRRLTTLIETVSPAMQEEETISFLYDDWTSIVPDGNIRKDAMGNIEFSIRRDNSFPTIALVAHADTICIQITHKIGDGKYSFRSIGCSPHMLLGQNVIIVNEAGDKYDGVIGFDATSQFGQPKGLIFEDLWIDVTNPTYGKSIEIGDLAVLKPHFSINGDYITATALDDRLGLFIIGEVLRWYSQTKVPVNLTCVATVQEEVGLRGSLAFEFQYIPDAVIVLDVDYATDIPTPHEDQMGRLYLQQGPGILRKADNSAWLRKLIKSVALAQNLPLQTSLGRFIYGGTDCSSLQVSRNTLGYHTANITLPCRYMHSPIETASISDIANAIHLIKSTVVSLSETYNLGSTI